MKKISKRGELPKVTDRDLKKFKCVPVKNVRKAFEKAFGVKIKGK